MKRAITLVIFVLVFAAGCAKKQPATAAGQPPPSTTTPTQPATPPPPPPRTAERVEEAIPVPSISEDNIANRSLEDLNRDSPFKPAFFGLDSAELDEAGRAVVAANADIMKKYPSWVVTVEGHCDERGTAEYNLALGERRAKAAMNYLVSNGIEAARITTISYGKERPLCSEHNEACWSKNRNDTFLTKEK